MKTIAQIRHIGFGDVAVKEAQVRNHRFAFFIERKVFFVVLIADTDIELVRAAQRRIIAVQGQRKILIAVFAAVAVGCKERGVIGINDKSTGQCLKRCRFLPETWL